MERSLLFKEEGASQYGQYSLEITVSATKLPDLDQDPIREVAYDAARRIKTEVLSAVVANSPEAMQCKAEERDKLMALFPNPQALFVEEIPNGYCSDWCCRHLPWFVVTTSVGRIKIGWRKRVINIDWSETKNTKTSTELFVEENVTKYERTIHAWSLDDAKRYITAILQSAQS